MTNDPDFLKGQLAKIGEIVIGTQQQLAEFCKKLQKEIVSPIQAMWHRHGSEFVAAVKRIAEIYEKLPEGTRRALAILCQHGWYLDAMMTFPDMLELSAELKSGNIQTAECQLAEHYRNRAQAIGEELYRKFPHRAPILQSAFAAHDRGDYNLSIPVFLMQADGICHEITGVQLYQKKGGVPQTAEYVSQLAGDSFTVALLYPFTVVTPMTVSDRHRKNSDMGVLNRHRILHGESVEYGTETNSLKAISLLSYVAWILRE